MTDTKIIKLCGGLGNQMFQYALGVSLAHRGNRVLYDTSWYGNKKDKRVAVRALELKHFKLDLPVASASEIRRVSNIYWGRLKMPKFIRPLFSHIFVEKQKDNYIKNADFEKMQGDSLFAGIFAHQGYFDSYRDDILKAFSLKISLSPANQKMLKKIKSCEAVSIHIRRGDYVKLGWVQDMSYYEKAIKQIKEKVKNPHFFIFSDDLAWVRENLKLTEAHTFVDINDGNTGYFDLELMKNCKHNIIANSTFSWWASYLNENPDKIVITPKGKHTPTVDCSEQNSAKKSQLSKHCFMIYLA